MQSEQVVHGTAVSSAFLLPTADTLGGEGLDRIRICSVEDTEPQDLISTDLIDGIQYDLSVRDVQPKLTLSAYGRPLLDADGLDEHIVDNFFGGSDELLEEGIHINIMTSVAVMSSLLIFVVLTFNITRRTLGGGLWLRQSEHC
jgi:hypothetical protein